MSPDQLLADRFVSNPTPITLAALAAYRVREQHRVAALEGATLAANDATPAPVSEPAPVDASLRAAWERAADERAAEIEARAGLARLQLAWEARTGREPSEDARRDMERLALRQGLRDTVRGLALAHDGFVSLSAATATATAVAS